VAEAAAPRADGDAREQLRAPAERGALHVADKVVLAIARAAALRVPGVAPASATSGLISSAIGRDLPRASAQVAGSRARVELQVASLWPHPAAQVAAGVRDAVTAQLEQLAAVRADSVSVTVDAVVRPDRSQRAARGRVQ